MRSGTDPTDESAATLEDDYATAWAEWRASPEGADWSAFTGDDLGEVTTPV